MAGHGSGIPDGYGPLAGSHRNRMAGARLTGRADPDGEVSLTIMVRRRPDGPPMPGIDAFTSLEAGRRHRRSGPGFAARYGALPRDLAAVEEFAASSRAPGDPVARRPAAPCASRAASGR